MKTVRLAIRAMATRFEIVLLGDDEGCLRAAGEEALREISSLDSRLSYYSDTSELSKINHRAVSEPVPVAPDLFALLKEAERFVIKTGGAFDPAIGPLMRCWGFLGGTGSIPDPDRLDAARAISGFQLVGLNENPMTIRFDRAGVELDLGGIAKGYALDEASRILKEHGISNALLHGGTSTVVGIGNSYDGTPWRIGIQDSDTVFGTIELKDCALSVSAPSGKFFTRGERTYSHVLDPRTGEPVSEASVAAVVSRSATKCDALSTAALVLGRHANQLRDTETGVAVWAKADPYSVLFLEGLPKFVQHLD